MGGSICSFCKRLARNSQSWVIVCGKLTWMGHGSKREKVPRSPFTVRKGQGWWVAVRCSILTARKAGYKGEGEEAKSHCNIFNYLIWCYLCTTADHDTYESNKHNY